MERFTERNFEKSKDPFVRYSHMESMGFDTVLSLTYTLPSEKDTSSWRYHDMELTGPIVDRLAKLEDLEERLENLCATLRSRIINTGMHITHSNVKAYSEVLDKLAVFLEEVK